MWIKTQAGDTTVLGRKKISPKFVDTWDIVHCIGAIDGEHIELYFGSGQNLLGKIMASETVSW